MADDLARFIGDRGLETATIIGHSLGGKTAMLAALRNPAMVEALVVVDIAPVRYRHNFLAEVDAMRALDLVDGCTGGPKRKRLLRNRSTIPALRKFLVQNLATGPKGLVWKLNLPAIERAMSELIDFPYVADWEYDGRALFVSGDRSDYISRIHDRPIFALFPQAEFAVIADAGHRVHFDQPDAFTHRLSRVSGERAGVSRGPQPSAVVASDRRSVRSRRRWRGPCGRRRRGRRGRGRDRWRRKRAAAPSRRRRAGRDRPEAISRSNTLSNFQSERTKLVCPRSSKPAMSPAELADDRPAKMLHVEDALRRHQLLIEYIERQSRRQDRMLDIEQAIIAGDLSSPPGCATARCRDMAC